MNNKLLETLADIAYHAGQQGYYTGDSRADINTFIYWAHEFEKQHASTDWGDTDYMLEIERYVMTKLTN